MKFVPPRFTKPRPFWRVCCLLFVLLVSLDAHAQFPWGRDDGQINYRTGNPTERPKNTNPTVGKATLSTPEQSNTSGSSTTSRNTSNPGFKPGMSAYHRQNLGKAINFDSLYKIDGRVLKSKTHGCTRSSWVVYGFHPNWMGSAWKSYNYKVLTHVAYFAYVIDLNTGGPSDIGDWAKTDMVPTAQAAGCKVHLTVTTVGSGGRSRQMLNSETIGAACIDSIASRVKQRQADGVCIDFEDMESQDTLAFVNWVKKLQTRLRVDNPKAEIAIACNASGERTIFSLPTLDKIVDYMVIMGYDYTWSGSKNAGCTAPLKTPNIGLNLESTVDDYLKYGIRANHLVLALPYYGDQWVTKGGDATSLTNSEAISFEGAVTYRDLVQSVSKDYKQYYDSNSRSTYYVKPNGSSYLQAWVMDSVSMSYRFNMIKNKKIAGVGIWALGYDNGETALWDLLNVAFGACDSATLAGGAVRLPNKIVNEPEPQWLEGNYRSLTLLLLAVLLILSIVLWIDPKAREEVMNRYLLFPFAAFVLMVIGIVIYEYIHDYLEWMSPRFPWIAAIGTGILILGYYFGRIWTDKRNQDR